MSLSGVWAGKPRNVSLPVQVTYSAISGAVIGVTAGSVTNAIVGNENNAKMVVKSAISGAVGGLVGFGITKGVNHMQVNNFLKENVLPERRNNVKSAFCNDIKLITLKNDTSINRYYGEKSSKISKWYTPYKYDNPKSKLALPPGNSGEYIDEKTISSGTKILEGTVAPNFGQKGGGYQYYVPNLETVLI